MSAPLAHLGQVRITRYGVVRVILGLILLTAAGLKGFQVATEPVAETGLLTSRWFLIGLVEFELFLGLWLLAGLYPRGTWRAALLCFSAFASVSLYKTLSGEVSCGCFGKVPVNPWYALLLDLTAIAALVCWRPAPGPSPVPPSVASSRRRGARLAAVGLLVGIPAAVAMGSYRAATVGRAGDILGDGQFVVLEPESWVAKRFPLLSYIDIGDQLVERDWIVVLYHHDCSSCRELIRDYEQVGRVSAMSSGGRQVALIELPPYGSKRFSSGASCRQGRLSDAKKWFVATPVECTLERALVTKVSHGLEELRVGEITRVSISEVEKERPRRLVALQ